MPTYGEQFSAQYKASQIEQDAWGKSNRVRGEVLAEINAVVGALDMPEPDAQRRPAQQISPRDARERQVLERAEWLAAEDPERFADLPTTPEDFRAEVNRRLVQEYEGLLGVAEAGPSDRIGARALGRLASGVTDEATLLTLPLGAGAGSMARVIAVEAAAGAAGEALMLPRQFRMAERLDIEDPNVLLQLGVAGATGGLLGGGAIGAARYLQHRRGQAAALAEGRPVDQSPIDYERDVETAEEQLRDGLPPVAATAASDAPIADRLMADLQEQLELEPHQVAGIVGNLAHETAGFRTLQEIAPLVPGSRGGFGYAQWTGPRRRDFEAWAAERGVDPRSYEANRDFLIHELTNTPEGKVLAQLRGASNAAEATQIFSRVFLRPGIPHMDSRLNWAQRAFDGEIGTINPDAVGRSAGVRLQGGPVGDDVPPVHLSAKVDDLNVEFGDISFSQDLASISRAQDGQTLPPNDAPFGPVLQEFENDWRGAVQALKGLQDGEARGALTHPDLGAVSLVWGETGARGKGYGLSKIIDRHPEVLDDLQGRLEAATEVVSESDNRVRLASDRDVFVISREWRGNKRPEWLLTAYQKQRGTDRSMGRASELPEGSSPSAPLRNQDNAGALPDQDDPLDDLRAEFEAASADGSVSDLAPGANAGALDAFEGGATDPAVIAANDATLADMRAQIEDAELSLREAGVDLSQMTFEDANGVEITMADFLEDIEDDSALMAAVDVCTSRGGA
ncbi:MAG: phage tail tip lysozyme [Pseudomonadota bacterium]